MEAKEYHMKLTLYYEDYKEVSMLERDFIISIIESSANQPPILLR